MRKIICTALLLLAVPLTSFSSSGQTTATFLTIVPDPTAVAMGDGCVALAHTPGMTMINPAGIAALTRSKLSLAYLLLPADIRYHYAGLGVPTRFGSIGLSVAYLTYGSIQGYYNDFTAYDMPAPYDLSVNLTYATPIATLVPIAKEYGQTGVTVKIIHSSLGDYVAEGIAVDVGGVYHIPFLKGLDAGVAYRNIGNGLKYVSQTNPLPTTLAAGISYTNNNWRNMATTIDYEQPTWGPTSLSYGISIKPAYFVTVRGGWRQTKDSLASGPRMGFGLDFGSFSLNYAFAPFSEFAPTHHIGVDVAIGDFSSGESASDYYLKYHFEQAKECIHQQDYIGGRQILEEILGLYPDFTPAKQLLGTIDNKLNDEWQRKQAQIDRLFRKADSALSTHDLIIAKKFYASVISIDPDNARAKAGLDNVDKEMTGISMENMRRKNFKQIQAIWKEGVKLFKKGKYVDAEDKFKAILEIDPENAASKTYLIEIANQLAKITENQISQLFELGVQFYRKGRFEAAQKYFEAVAISSPNRQDVKDYVQRCIEAIADAAEKARSAKVATEQGKVRAEIDTAFDSGLSAYEKNSYFKALENFEKARELAIKYEFNEIKIDSDKYIALSKTGISDYYYKEGFALYQRNKFEDAYEDYRKALSFNSENTAARVERDRLADVLAQQYYEKGMDAYTKGETEKARTNFRASLNYKPGKIESQRALERIK